MEPTPASENLYASGPGNPVGIVASPPGNGPRIPGSRGPPGTPAARRGATRACSPFPWGYTWILHLPGTGLASQAPVVRPLPPRLGGERRGPAVRLPGGRRAISFAGGRLGVGEGWPVGVPPAFIWPKIFI